jgi:hypothetical protein
MPATYTLIASTTLSTTSTLITFSSIPATYTDLVLRFSARLGNAGSDDWTIQPNGSNTNGTSRMLYRDGSQISYPPASTSNASLLLGKVPGTSITSNTFGSCEVYIPNYTGSTAKMVSCMSIMENNAVVLQYIHATAGLYNNTTALTSLDVRGGGSQFVSGSSFFLYGIKNS